MSRQVGITTAPDTKQITVSVCDFQGLAGANGKSAFEIAKENNLTNATTEKEWIEDLNSAAGVPDDFLSIYELAKG